MVAANRVCERIKSQNQDGGEHLCFLSTGRENEDQYVNMVVAKFLQNSVPFVSVAQGGFVGISIHPYTHPSISPSIYPSVHPFIHLPFHPSIPLSVHWFIH